MILHRAECEDVFGLYHMRLVGRPNQDLKTKLHEGEPGGGRVLVQTLQNITKQ